MRARARVCVFVCVCVLCVLFVCVHVCCVCVGGCYGEVAASISRLAYWYMVFCIYMYICKCTNVRKIVWVCFRHPSQPQTLKVFEFMLFCLSLLCCSPFRQAAAVRIEGVKGEVTVMSKAACFHLSQLRTNTSAGQVWVRSGVTLLPNSTLSLRWA